MGEAAQLITAIAALITATGGAVSVVIVALTAMRRQRHTAAEEAGRLTRGDGHEPTRHRHRAARGHVGVAEIELAVAVAEVARDSRELALETRRELRLDALEAHDRAEHAAHDGGGDQSVG